jgi:hypothetical protein
MNYILDYWAQIKIFYGIVFKSVFAKERNLDDGISAFVPKPGFLWEVIEVHKWVARSVWLVIRNTVQLIMCYASMAILCLFLLLAPVFILMMFPVFTVGKYRRIREQGARL